MPKEYPKYTVSVSGPGKVSISLRTDKREEMDAFLEEFRTTADEPRKKKRYMHIGDACLSCSDGTLAARVSKKEGEDDFHFLGCTNFPRCEFTAYQSKFPKKDN